MAGAVNVPLDAGDRGTLNLVFKFGTIGDAERELGAPLTTAMASGTLGFDALGAIFWAVLQPSLRITREGSNDLVDELGVEAITGAIVKGLGQYFGGGEAAEEGAAPGEATAPGEAGAAKKGK